MDTSTLTFYIDNTHTGTATYTSRGKPINIKDTFLFELTRY